MKNVVLFLVLFVFSLLAKAEGTKELRPDSNQYAGLLMEISKTYTLFGQYGAPSSQQIKIRISSTSETFYFGMNNMTDTGNFIQDLAYRIVSPSGAIVFSSATFPGPGQAGNISNYKQAAAGPKQLGNPDGYNGIQITPGETGDYVIEFDTAGVGRAAFKRINLQYFDVTVADVNNKPVPGRLHSQGWQISTSSFGIPFNGKVYTYDGGSAVYKVDFNKMKPFVFVTNFNSKGTGSGSPSTFLQDRQSVKGNHTNPEYEVFLNPPDSLLYPVTPKDVHLFGAIKKDNCAITEFCFASDSPGFLDGFLDFNNNGLYDANLGEILFGRYIDNVGDTVCIPWDGKDNNGVPVTGGNFKILSKFGFGITHLPVYDVENNTNGLIVERVRPPGPRPALFWDDSQIPLSPAVTPDPRVNLSGCTNASGCHTWSWDDNKKIDDTLVDYGNNNTINTWWYSSVVFDTMVYTAPFPEKVSLSYSSSSFDHRDTLLCKGDSLSFYIYNDGVNHFNPAKYNYAWVLNNIPLNPDVRQQKEKINANTEVVVIASNKVGPLCPSSDTLRVSIVNPVRITSVVTVNCNPNPGNISVSLTSVSPNAKFVWKEFPANASGILNNLPAGQYHLSVNESSIAHCGIDTVFTIPPSPGIQIDTVIAQSFNCNNASSTGSASVLMKDNTKQYEYSWDNAAWSDQAMVSGLGAGLHQVVARDKTTLCTDNKSFSISSIPLSHSLVKKDEVCSDKQGNIVLTLPPVNLTISWNSVSGKLTNLTNLAAGNYTIQVQSPLYAACKFDTTVTIVNTGSPVKADFTIQPPASDSFQIGEVIVLSNTSGNVASSLWEFGDGTSAASYNATHAYGNSGTFLVRLQVEDANGCPGEISKILMVATSLPCGPALPNAFSPNADGMNETIGVLGDADNVDLKIFNRWGEVIFRTQGSTVKQTLRWDGSYRGAAVPIGVYPYILEYDCAGSKDGQKRHKKFGDITLVR